MLRAVLLPSRRKQTMLLLLLPQDPTLLLLLLPSLPLLPLGPIPLLQSLPRLLPSLSPLLPWGPTPLRQLLLTLLPSSTLGLELSSAARARACSVSLGLGGTLGWRALGPDVPHGAVLTPVREAPGVAAPRRMLLLAVLVHAVVASPDRRADLALPGPYPVSWSAPSLRLGTSLSLEPVRDPTHSPPSP